MKKVSVGVLSAVFVALMATNGFAVSIDPDGLGVVGTIETGTQNSNPTNEIQWSQYLLNLALADTATVDANTPLDGKTEDYDTNDVHDYSGLLTQVGGGTQVAPGSDITNYEYVLGKYNGQNAGYVLFNVSELGGTTIPLLSDDIWTNNQGNGYGLSHITVFNETDPNKPPQNVIPEPATVLLFGSGLAGLGLWRWKTAKKA